MRTWVAALSAALLSESILIETDKIKEHGILKYYRTRMSEIDNNFRSINMNHPDVKEYEDTKEILALIKKYCDLTAGFKEDKKSNSSKN
jgi:hypothetical protein